MGIKHVLAHFIPSLKSIQWQEAFGKSRWPTLPIENVYHTPQASRLTVMTITHLQKKENASLTRKFFMFLPTNATIVHIHAQSFLLLQRNNSLLPTQSWCLLLCTPDSFPTLLLPDFNIFISTQSSPSIYKYT